MGKTSSAVWQYFSFPKQAATPKEAVCNVLVNGNECGKQLAKQSAWNAKRHLRDIHGIDLFTVDEQRRKAAPTKIGSLKLALRNAREERARLLVEFTLAQPPSTPRQDEIPPALKDSGTYRTSSADSLPQAERRKEQNRRNVQKHRHVERILEQALHRILDEIAQLKASRGAAHSQAQASQSSSSALTNPAQARDFSAEINGFFGALLDRQRGSPIHEYNQAAPKALAICGQKEDLDVIPLEWVDEIFQMWDTCNADLRPLSQLDDPLIPFICRYKELFTVNMRRRNAPLDHAFREVQRWYAAGMADSPVGTRSHSKLRGCFVLEVEKDFLRHLMQNVSVWTVLVSLKSAIAVGTPDECGILHRLYCILCRTAAAVLDDSSCYKNEDDDFLILVGESEMRRGSRLKSRLTAADREYFYSPLSFDRSMMHSLMDTVMHDLDTQLLGGLVCDVFSFTLSGSLNFNFYEECATLLPNLREAFKQCVQQLPREHVQTARLSRAVVEYERTLPFTGAYYHQRCIILGHWHSCYRARKHPRTLKRYAIDTLHLSFYNRNNLMRHFKHLDVVCPEFLTYMSNVRAQHIVLSGFGRHHMREAIDKAKYSALHAEYVQCICFESNCIDQFEAILENGRELPKTTQNLCISMRTPYRKKIPAPRLNPKKRGASEAFFLPHGFVSGYEVARIIEQTSANLHRITLCGQICVDIELHRSVKVVDALSAVECFFEMFMTKSIVPRIKLTIANAANNIKQLMLFGLTNGFMAKSDSISKRYTDLTMGRLRDDGRAFEIRIFEESDDNVRAVIGIGEPQTKSKDHHSDYWNHSHRMDLEIDYYANA